MLKTSEKMYEVIFLIYESMYILKVYSVQSIHSIHIEIKQKLKQNYSEKITGTKNALFFLSRTPTCHSFTFNLQFLSERKHI